MHESEATGWVSALLRAEEAPAMPSDVESAIVAALREEVAHRAGGALAAEAKQAFDEVEQRSSTGTFGVNPPSHYDKPGLGLREVTSN